VAAKPTGGSKSKLNDKDMESIQLIVLDQPDITLAQLRERFIADGGTKLVSTSTLWRALGKLGMTRKKSRTSTRGAVTPT
jgi:transposase